MADLPAASVGPMRNPKRELARFYARLVVVLAVLTAVLAVLAGHFSDASILAGVLLVGGGLVFAYTCGALMARSAARGVDRQLEEFRRGQHLAVWHCSADEWRRFAEAFRQRVGKEEGKIRLAMMGIFAAIGALFGGCTGFACGADVGVGEVVGVLLGVLLGAPIGAGLGFAYDWASGWGPRSAARRRYRHARGGGGPTYVGPKGAYSNGEFHGWGDVWSKLLSASFVEGDPPYLHLILGRPGTTENAPEDVFVPVPAGHEDEARKTAGRLQGSAPGRQRQPKTQKNPRGRR
jgi:hypothetical protein